MADYIILIKEGCLTKFEKIGGKDRIMLPKWNYTKFFQKPQVYIIFVVGSNYSKHHGGTDENNYV